MRARLSIAPFLLLALISSTACKKSADTKPAAGSASAPVHDAAVAVATADAAAQVPDPASLLARPYLWEVEKDGKRGYFLGTMHLGVDADRSLPPWVWSRFEAAKTFAMEVDATDPSLIKSVMRSDGTTLDKELGPEAWAKLEGALGSQMANGAKSLKASAAATLVMLQGLPMTAPMDLTLAQKAKDAGKKIVYLEAAQLQQALLDKWMDAKALRAMLEDISKVRANNEELLAAYRGGDDAVLVELVNDKTQWTDFGLDAKKADKAIDELLYSRNRAWVAPLEKMLAEGDVFIGVGVAHLVGDKSVLSLLEKKGYKVRRVTE